MIKLIAICYIPRQSNILIVIKYSYLEFCISKPLTMYVRLWFDLSCSASVTQIILPRDIAGTALRPADYHKENAQTS